MKTVALILKYIPSTMCGAAPFPSLFPSLERSMQWGHVRGTHMRFTGMIGKMGYMEVFCNDDRCPELYENHMVWKISNDCSNVQRFWGNQGKLHGYPALVQYHESGRDLLIIRLRFYWVMRGIIGFKRILTRIRIRRKNRRKQFIQATYWGHSECKLRCFAGTINTPVKQRIHGYI